MTDRINWEHVQKLMEREEPRAIWRPYGLPEILDPLTSRLADVAVQPAWSIPDSVVITQTVTGGFYSHRANPDQPITPDEIRQSADECVRAGAPSVHIHVRDDRGYNTLSPERFRSVVEPLRHDHPQIVAEACLVFSLKGEWERMKEVLAERLFDIIPVNPTATFCGDSLFAKPPHLLIEKTRLVQEAGAIAQVAVYTDADVDNADRYLIKSGLLKKPYLWVVLPGLPGGSPMHNPRQMIDGLTRIVQSIYDVDASSVISVCAAGRASSYLATLALLMGLHIRVGMEDTVWMWPHKDQKITRNAEHFRMFRALAELLGRRLATADEYRSLIGLPRRAMELSR